jgi:hypothetical protein
MARPSRKRSQPIDPIDVAIEEVAMSVSTNGTTQAPRPAPAQRRVTKPVPIVLDKPRTMRFDFAAMDRFEEATGLSAWSSEVWSRPSPRIVGHIIWASLLHEDPDLTYNEVCSFEGMDISNFSYLTERIGELWGNDMPEATEGSSGDGETSDPNASLQTGSSSEA